MAIKLIELHKIQIPHHLLRMATALRGFFMSFKRDEYVSLRTLTHSHACIGEGQDVGKHPALNGWLVNTTVLFNGSTHVAICPNACLLQALFPVITH